MLLLLSSLLLIVHWTFLTWPVTCQWSANDQKGVDQFNQRMLQGLNLSEPPRPKKTSRCKSYHIVDSSTLLFPSSRVTDLEIKDVVAFRLSSCVSTHVLDVNNASLVFKVHSTKHLHSPVVTKQPSRWDMGYNKLIERIEQLKTKLQKCRHKSQRFNESVDEQVNATGSLYQPLNLSHSGNNSFTSDQPVNSTLDTVSDSSASVNLSRLHLIKVVINTTTSRKRKVAVNHIEVTSGMSVTVSVPIKYLRRIAGTGDQTVTLQIQCKRCGQHTWIKGVYRRQKRSGKNCTAKIRNFDVPILLIEMKNDNCTDQL